MSQLPVAYIDIRLCAHATEDINKVVNAVKNILPTEKFEEIQFKQSSVDGHYGNPITFFESRIKDKKIIKKLVESISSNLSFFDKQDLTRDIDRYVEKGSLYIRLDKQAAYHEKTKLVKSDPIRIRIRFRKKKLEDIIKICKEIGILT